MKISEIKKLIKECEDQFKIFERPSANNSKKLLELVKKYLAKKKTDNKIYISCG